MAGKGVPGRIAAQNRKARHDYFIEDTFDAGIILTGSEVKSLREGRANINDSYAAERNGELFLFGAHISEYAPAKRANHEPLRIRKLLLHKRELAKLFDSVNRQGMTLIPLAVYFNDRGFAKVQLGLAKGKQKQDKRASIKEREWKRDKARVMRAKG
ncbi:MAG: SsrA-binding protein SmpB [Rhodospirillales bacterium]|nr:SsrA-binding protein SmpB [Rhodospirillales bacterium]MCW8862732.1 SsrA-binding protein SmpB [Rhodospirillales bacterium]MCW8951099.1 SsrA-binding protein SmpB [Rhodospirillales bacterium]MCW8971046.1 SsrA-binding protein SmpB [Rhodospirillales bacterium]MCW9003426.1 SsrA-binding protein SmpB [Rhodospirillales bacterium]